MKYMKVLHYLKKYKVLFGTGFVLLLIVTSFSIKATPSKALLGFGGQVEDVITCTCSDNIAIVVGTPTPGVFIWEPTTTIYEHYSLFSTGSWTLGTYTTGGVCLEISGPDCIQFVSPDGIIDSVGTSM